MNSCPDTLHLGSGKHFIQGYLNVDILERVKPDIVLDITKVEFGKEYDTRFGPIQLREGMFKRIVTNDCLEHIQDLVTAMKNCRDLLETGGTMHISVPYWLSLGADQDPTHVRRFNEMSWVYYCDWCWYLGWDRGFVMRSIEFKPSEWGSTLTEPLETLLRTPTAIDSMHVILEKQ